MLYSIHYTGSFPNLSFQVYIGPHLSLIMIENDLYDLFSVCAKIKQNNKSYIVIYIFTHTLFIIIYDILILIYTNNFTSCKITLLINWGHKTTSE